jgi:hypothetical protein
LTKPNGKPQQKKIFKFRARLIAIGHGKMLTVLEQPEFTLEQVLNEYDASWKIASKTFPLLVDYFCQRTTL